MNANRCKCIEQECKEYYDLCGNAFCICTKQEPIEELPLLIAPLPFPMTTGHQSYKRAKITKDVIKKRGVSVIQLAYPMEVGSIILVQGNPIKYYLKKRLFNRNNYSTFAYEIRRVDEDILSYLDLNKLTKGRVARVTGYFTDKKNN